MKLFTEKEHNIMEHTIEALKYPVGKYTKPVTITPTIIKDSITILGAFPQKIKDATKNLGETELGYLHRPEGWTIRQLVHHCADSHLNAFIRIKLTLTEESPTVKPYIEREWAKLPDTTEAPVEWSLMIIEGVHKRWVMVMNNMKEADFQRAYFHPEYQRSVKLEELLPMYAWHCGHHLAHIQQALKHKNKF